MFCSYEQWCKAHDTIGVTDLPKELQGIYRCLNTYHENNHDHQDLTVADLSNLYFSTRPRDRDFAVKVFEQLNGNSEAKPETVAALIKSITRGKLLRQLSLDAYEAAEGRIDFNKVQALVHQFIDVQSDLSSNVPTSAEDTFVSDDIEELVTNTIKTHGLRWRLNILNKMLGSLRFGNFGFIFARPETGKTTFLASEATHMASQLADDAGPILWFNNEEVGSNVMIRVYQAALGLTMTELFRDLKGAREKYHQITKGKLKLFDNGEISKQTVEKLCKQYKPSLIIFDQIDKIRGFDNDREDLRLGSIYTWARELAKVYGPTIGVCQADGSGEGQRWLTMANVANAKTSKQAEADWILGIGKVDEPGYDTLRFLHLSKNKLIGDDDSDPELRHGRKECLIDADKARYRDI